MFISGIIVGILLSILAVLTGKKLSVTINQEPAKPSPVLEKGKPKMAQVIKMNADPIEEALK